MARPWWTVVAGVVAAVLATDYAWRWMRRESRARRRARQQVRRAAAAAGGGGSDKQGQRVAWERLSEEEKQRVLRFYGLRLAPHHDDSPRPFDVSTAAVMAGFSFASYDTPRIQRQQWEWHNDTLGVAYLHDAHVVQRWPRVVAVDLRGRQQVQIVSADGELVRQVSAKGVTDKTGTVALFYLPAASNQGAWWRHPFRRLRRAVKRAANADLMVRTVAEGESEREAQHSPPEPLSRVATEVAVVHSVADLRRMRTRHVAEGASLLREGTIRSIPEAWSGWLPSPSHQDATAVAFIESSDTDTQVMVYQMRQDVVVAFRGTVADNWGDLVTDLKTGRVPMRWEIGEQEERNPKSTSERRGAKPPTTDPAPAEAIPQVHQGFWEAYCSVRPALLGILAPWLHRTTALREFLGREPTVYLTGHSLGGALAALAAVDLVQHRLVPQHSLVLYNFGAPRVGDERFAQRFDQLVPCSFRVSNYKDGVPRCPTPSMGFDHCGRCVLMNGDEAQLYVDGEYDGDNGDAPNPIVKLFTTFGDFMLFESQSLRVWISGEAIEHHKEQRYADALRSVLQGARRPTRSTALAVT
ncbi:hypothetical protein CDCA_CDCA11G3287 [Cyanidium caldarium]|uniref:Fungal lipase-type domain-containing protein n=1 Tax=Cyanidium caldarium TaxID=2771 RepID=A0AAV9IYA5_CYACA|nr:hypothetical protein CDCA_CDCA11G3287 [Cyanidium caldarium]